MVCGRGGVSKIFPMKIENLEEKLPHPSRRMVYGDLLGGGWKKGYVVSSEAVQTALNPSVVAPTSQIF